MGTEGCFQRLDGAAGARAEARGLLALVRGNAASVEAIIGVSPRIETVLRFYRDFEQSLWFPINFY